MGLISTFLYCLHTARKAKKYRAMGKEGLFALDDESFYNAVECICHDIVCDVHDQEITEEQRTVYALMKFEAEVNNGGLCQFFVNSSGECAPYISDALAKVGAEKLKALYDSFIENNHIDPTDLSSFKIQSVEEYEAQTKRFDFDSFDDRFYEDGDIHQQILAFARQNIDQILKV